MGEVVNIFCIYTTDPHYIVIQLADGQVPIQLPVTLYEQLAPQFGWPPNPCDAIGAPTYNG